MGTLGNWYAPLSCVVVTNGCCRVGPVTVTVTPGNVAPDGSVTLPKIVPIACAWATPADTARIAATSRIPRKPRVICTPPSFFSCSFCPRIQRTTDGTGQRRDLYRGEAHRFRTLPQGRG